MSERVSSERWRALYATADLAGTPGEVRLGPALAQGGDAAVHTVVGRPDLVAKLYHHPGAEPRRRAKLEAMLAGPPAGRRSAGGFVEMAWPESLLRHPDDAPASPPAGYLMPRVDLRRAALLESMMGRRARQASGLPEGYRARVAAAHNLAALVAALHAAGHHVVDLKPANVHVYRDTSLVALLDCDGFSVAVPGGERFPAHQYTDGYTAPEALAARARPEALGEAQDRFALAVIVFRLLNGGLHPFQGVPAPGRTVPTSDGERVAARLYPYGRRGPAGRLRPSPMSVHARFDEATRRLFDRAFDGSDDDRPSAEAWRDHLRGLLDGGLRPCPADPDHARFGDGPCVVCPVPPTPLEALGAEARELRDGVARRSAAAGQRVAAARRRVTAAGQRVAAAGQRVVARMQARLGRRRPSVAPAAQAAAQTPLSPRREAVLELLAALLWGVLVTAGIVGSVLVLDDGPRWADEGVDGAMRGRDIHRFRAAMRGEAERDAERVTYGPDPTALLPTQAYGPLMETGGFSDAPLWPAVPGEGFGWNAGGLHQVALAHRPRFVAEWLAWVGAYRVLGEGDNVGRTPLVWALVQRPVLDLQRAEVPEVLAAADRVVDAVRAAPEASSRVFDAVALIDELAVPVAWESERDAFVRLVAGAATVQVLLDAGADPEAADEWGRTPLFYAVATGNLVAVHQLLFAGARPDAADASGATPLTVAADRVGSREDDPLGTEIVQTLLAAGASASAADIAGRRPRDFVESREHAANLRSHFGRYGSYGTLDSRTPWYARSATVTTLDSAAAGASEAEGAPFDLGDGGTRFTAAMEARLQRGYAGDLPLDDYPLPPWVSGDTLSVVCPDLEPGVYPVAIRLERTRRFFVARRTSVGSYEILYQAPRHSAGPRRFGGSAGDRPGNDCLLRVEDSMPRVFDVRAEPERRPSGRIAVSVTETQGAAGQPAPTRPDANAQR